MHRNAGFQSPIRRAELTAAQALQTPADRNRNTTSLIYPPQTELIHLPCPAFESGTDGIRDAFGLRFSPLTHDQTLQRNHLRRDEFQRHLVCQLPLLIEL